MAGGPGDCESFVLASATIIQEAESNLVNLTSIVKVELQQLYDDAKFNGLSMDQFDESADVSENQFSDNSILVIKVAVSDLALAINVDQESIFNALFAETYVGRLNCISIQLAQLSAQISSLVKEFHEKRVDLLNSY